MHDKTTEPRSGTRVDAVDDDNRLAEGVARDTAAAGTGTTGQKRIEHELLKFMLGIERSGEAIFLTEPDGTITYVNPTFVNVYGYSESEAIGRTPRILKSGVVDAQMYVKFWETLLAKQVVKGEIINKTKDGRLLCMDASANPILNDRGDIVGFLAIQRDITQQKRLQQARDVEVEIFRDIDRYDTVAETVRAVVSAVRKATGIEAVGIRLRDGEDFPYFETSGFPEMFVEAERSLCCRDENGGIIRDTAGNVFLECMCGAVITGRTDPSKSYFTSYGSFRTNRASDLLAATTEADRGVRTRNRCDGGGYESVALIPLRAGQKTLGLLQLNDRRRDMFSAESMQSYEVVARAIAMAFERREAQEAERHGRAVASAVAEATLDFLTRGDAVHCIRLVTEHAARLTGAHLAELLDVDRKGGIRCRAVCGEDAARLLSTEELAGAKQAVDRDGLLPVEMGGNLITTVIRNRTPLMTNHPAGQSGWAGRLPFGHPPIENLLAIPLLSEEKVLGALVLANRSGGFRDRDRATVEALANVATLVLHATDEREKRELVQQQLIIAQRLESVGRLAGGMAHDLNNILTVINSYTDFAIEELRESDPMRSDLIEVRKAGDRATSLTKQLLAFSRKQVLKPIVVNLNDVIIEQERMLRRLIGEDLDFRTVLAADLGNCLADVGQIEQVIMNLVVNARDAMARGGILTIETGNIEIDEDYVDHYTSLKPGPYVMFAVTDNGVGMDESVRSRLFEPFFTTKRESEGTGLGLSTAYGIIKQSQGDIRVYSEPGKGTTFKVLLPRVDKKTVVRPKSAAEAVRDGGSETVLVAEDNSALREMTKRILETAGYNVLVAANGTEALQYCERTEEPIHLLLTDVVMPGMSGREVADRLVEKRPAVRVLYMSGYPGNAIAHHGVLDRNVHFISKPFTAAELKRMIRDLLDTKC